ncbi:MAG: hypothetical protein DWQ04_34685 [Chloroflexi bacterium]|nr:MAG: hypothetical protein DWQ04_34685 [Chloroflexota bacterium]
MAAAGISLILATVGMWNGRYWWLLFFGIFVGIRLVVRFPDDVLNNDSAASVLKYVALNLGWIIIGLETS